MEMPTGRKKMMDLQGLSDAASVLTFEERFINPTVSTGLWWCATAEDVHAAEINAVCLGLGRSWDDLSLCKNFLKQFRFIFVVIPDKQKRDEAVKELQKRCMGISVLIPCASAFHGCTSIAEIRAQGGISAVNHLLMGAIELPAHGLLDLADVQRVDMSKVPCVGSGIQELDRAIGGFFEGEVSVWTGRRGEGKSTLLSQLLIEAVNQGMPVCAYSGELPAWRFKAWASLQAAGPEHITCQTDPGSGKEYYSVPQAVQSLIDDWWAKRFLLFDNTVSSSNDADAILEVFNYAVRRYNCCVFLIDNLMSIRMQGDQDYYRQQGEFTGRLAEFAKKQGVHVHLIAHPRKTGKDTGNRLDADDVGGSGEITNRADNVFALRRLADEKAEEKGFSSVLSILKNRSFGSTISVGLDFEPGSRRFYKAGTGNPNKKYGWNFMQQIELEEVADDENNPFG
ncbi:hypothetical protein SDC9_65052 [bioreactor metagenome]|uniref:SF4 helicase domain-containing protein n=1 Tax=bioreactor metagenome TaxID=1076179 RepID=A0A644XRC3_9ZZZZ